MKKGNSPLEMRLKVIETAAELFAEKGIDRVSVREIVEKLGVTKPVLYYYFKNKEDLCRQIFSRGAEILGELQSGAGRPQSTLEEKLAGLFSSYLEFFKTRPKATQFFLKLISSPSGDNFKPVVDRLKAENKKRLAAMMEEAENRGEIEKGKTRDMIHLARGVISHLILNLREDNLEEFDPGFPERMARLICEGARPKTKKPGMMAVLAFCALITAGPAMSQNIPPSGELSIDKAVEIAVTNNTSVIMAEKSREIYRERIREYWGSVYPEIKASAQYTRNIEKPAFFINGQKIQIGSNHSLNIIAETTQVLWAGGKVKTGIHLAKLFSETSDEQARAARLAVARSVKQLYYSLLLASATVSIQQEALDTARQHLATMEEQFSQGIASDLTLLRQKVEVANTEPAVTQSKNLYEEGILELNNLLGLDPDESMTLSGRLECPAPEVLDIKNLYAAAFSAKPELVQARINLKIAREKIALEKSSLYPNLQAYANRQLMSQSSAFLPDPSERAWSSGAGLRLSLPIFSGGSTLSRIRQADLEKDEALEQLKDMERKSKIDVKRAWLSLNEAQERVKSQGKAVEQARKALNSTETRFKNGLAGQLELNDASLALSRSQMIYVQALHDSCAAKTDLDWATGK